MPREYVLHRTRTALGRHVGQPPAALPAVHLRLAEMDIEARIAAFFKQVQELGGQTRRARSPTEAGAQVEALLAGRPAVASNAPLLRQCGITALPSVRTGFSNAGELRTACAVAEFGITSADYALADTGTLVLFSSPEEARLISLLPPVHLAVLPRDRLLTGLDELMILVPQPAQRSSSMVLVTGPSRTADIEQILVRGVHGPGELLVIVV